MEENKKKIKKYGDRNEVFSGTALKTRAGLSKDDFMINVRGKIVSKKRSELGKKNISKLIPFKKIENEK